MKYTAEVFEAKFADLIPLEIGQLLTFLDMAHYTMVKNNTFNGGLPPAISLYSETNGLETVQRYGYEDYKIRLS